MIKVIKTNQFVNEVEGNEDITVVDFFATWCGPCKMLSPVFESLGEKMEENATFLKVDIDESLELAQKFQVSTVPTVIVFKEGKEVDRLIGFIPEQKLEAMVKSHI